MKTAIIQQEKKKKQISVHSDFQVVEATRAPGTHFTWALGASVLDGKQRAIRFTAYCFCTK